MRLPLKLELGDIFTNFALKFSVALPFFYFIIINIFIFQLVSLQKES